MPLTESDMKTHYTDGLKGKEDKWESGLIDKTPLTSVDAGRKRAFKRIADSPPSDLWYKRWIDAMSG